MVEEGCSPPDDLSHFSCGWVGSRSVAKGLSPHPLQSREVLPPFLDLTCQSSPFSFAFEGNSPSPALSLRSQPLGQTALLMQILIATSIPPADMALRIQPSPSITQEVDGRALCESG